MSRYDFVGSVKVDEVIHEYRVWVRPATESVDGENRRIPGAWNVYVGKPSDNLGTAQWAGTLERARPENTPRWWLDGHRRWALAATYDREATADYRPVRGLEYAARWLAVNRILWWARIAPPPPPCECA